MNGWMDRWIVGWMDGLINQWTGGWMDGLMDEQMDEHDLSEFHFLHHKNLQCAKCSSTSSVAELKANQVY